MISSSRCSVVLYRQQQHLLRLPLLTKITTVKVKNILHNKLLHSSVLFYENRLQLLLSQTSYFVKSLVIEK